MQNQAFEISPAMPVWQRNYYEHIVRNQGELHAIRGYIQENPLKWEIDQDNPVNLPLYDQIHQEIPIDKK